MKSNVIKIEQFRRAKRKDWLNQHNTQLDHFISKFLSINISTDFLEVSSIYQASRCQNHEASWDYSELREMIRNAFEQTLGDLIYQSLKKQQWFDATYINQDEVIDRCLSIYILGSIRSVSGS